MLIFIYVWLVIVNKISLLFGLLFCCVYYYSDASKPLGKPFSVTWQFATHSNHLILISITPHLQPMNFFFFLNVLCILASEFLISQLNYFLFQPVLHDWCNKGCGMCYPVCGMVHIKEPMLLIDKSRLYGGSGFPFSLSYV